MSCKFPAGRLDPGRDRLSADREDFVRTMPPLNPLRVFEVAARLGNFTRAANELNVTQSAVSRQIATLEDFVGTKLFQRESRGTVLTADGRQYFEEISPAFSKISAGTDMLVARHKTNTLRVAGYPTFAVKWLIPRLSRFNDVHRSIQVLLKTSIVPVNFDINPFDVAIQLRSPEEMNPEFSSLLFWDMIQPYCSPTLKTKCDLGSIEALKKAPRINSHYRRNDWDDWFAAMGHPGTANEGNEFPSSLLSYEAAMKGLGVVMGQTFLLSDDVQAGALVPLFEPVRRNLAYFVTWGKNTNYKTRNFVRWIQKEIENPT